MPPKTPFANKYHLRKVAPESSRACFVCMKPTEYVLVTEDGKNDFFYICRSHLNDENFASPVIQHVASQQDHKAEIEKEIESLKIKYEKKETTKKIDDEKNNLDNEKKSDDNDKDSKQANDTKVKKKDDKKDKNKQATKIATPPIAEQPESRIFILHKKIFQARLNKWNAKLDAQRQAKLLSKLNSFPSAPTADP